jgi:hypothetical protein
MLSCARRGEPGFGRRAMRFRTPLPSTTSIVGMQWHMDTTRTLKDCLHVRRDKAALSSGCKPRPAIAPAGSNRGRHGGDEMSEAPG